MARGDVVSEVASTSTGSSLTYQPAGSIEAVIKVWSGERLSSVYLEVFDGTTACIICASDKFSTIGVHINMSLPVNNAHYLRIRNNAGYDVALMYSGFITNAG